MLTEAILARRTAAQAKAIEAWSRKAAERTARGIADAQAHAAKALTDTLRATPDGRATIAQARRSKSYSAALTRLDELKVRLLMVVQDARWDFYEDSWAFWRAHMPAEFLRSGDDPRESEMKRAVGFVLHGMPLANWIRGPIDAAKKSLLPTLTRAGSRDAGDEGPDLIAAWAATARRAIDANTFAAVNDSWGICDRLAGRDVFKPELLHDDPTLPA